MDDVRPILALATCIALLATSDALAATVSVDTSAQFVPGSQHAAIYSAAPGERNRVVAGADPTTADYYDVVVRDTGATVAAGPGCESLDEHTARCAGLTGPPPYFDRTRLSILVDVGDGDDVVRAPASFETPVVVSAGDGNDVVSGAGVLSGDAGDDALTGGDDVPGYKGSGPPNDVLAGGPGDDVLRAGNGDDTLAGGAGADVIDGGGGTDLVSYADHAAGVRVDLADPAMLAGAPGERDRVSGVERVDGSGGDDVLLGNEERNFIDGGAGDDRVVGRDGWDGLYGGDGADVVDGRAGSDNLYGGAGADVLRGGAGDDDIQSGGGGDAVDGGPGSDTVFAGRPRALRCGSGSRDIVGIPRGVLLTDCETVFVGAREYPAYGENATIAARPTRRRGGGLAFAWSCDATADRCDMRVTVRVGPGTLGRRAAVLLKRGAKGEIVVAARRSIRRGRMLAVSISGAVYQATYPGVRVKRFTARWRVRA